MTKKPKKSRSGTLFHVITLLFAFFSCGENLPRESPSFPVQPPELSSEERAYLDALGPVTYCVDNDWAPYESVDARGEYAGIAADLFRLIAARSGVTVRLEKTRDWPESLAASKSGTCLILPFLNRTPEREEWLIFTKPYFTDPNVFITRADHDFIADPSRLSGESIALPSGTSVEELVRKRFPKLNVTIVASEREALRMVDRGTADMTLRSLTMAAHVIRKEGLFNLRISGQLYESEHRFRIGVSRREPMLRDILDRGIRTLKPEEIQAAVNAHVSIEAKTGIDHSPVVWMGGLFTAFSLLWVTWNLATRRYLKHLRLIIDTVPAFIFVKDPDGKYLLANRWTASAFGLPPEKIKGLTDRDCGSSDAEIAEWRRQDRKVLETGDPLKIDDHPGKRVDGSPGWFQTVKVPYKRPDSRSKAILGVTIDVTELKNAKLELERSEQRFKHLSRHDSLTGLPNRTAISEQLAREIALSDREGKKAAIVFLDLDRFKEVNDTLGHRAGDALLTTASDRMKANVRETDTVGRVGGDEFILLIHDVVDKETARSIAEKIRVALERPFAIEGNNVKVSASIGVAIYPNDGKDEVTLFRHADSAMYRSKGEGRNRVTSYDRDRDGE